MSENEKQISPEKEETQDASAIPEEQLADIAGGGYGIGGKGVREDIKVRDDAKVKRSGYAIGG